MDPHHASSGALFEEREFVHREQFSEETKAATKISTGENENESQKHFL